MVDVLLSGAPEEKVKRALFAITHNSIGMGLPITKGRGFKERHYDQIMLENTYVKRKPFYDLIVKPALKHPNGPIVGIFELERSGSLGMGEAANLLREHFTKEHLLDPQVVQGLYLALLSSLRETYQAVAVLLEGHAEFGIDLSKDNVFGYRIRIKELEANLEEVFKKLGVEIPPWQIGD